MLRPLFAREQRISPVTLGVSDLPRARRCYEDLGWRGQEVVGSVFYQAAGWPSFSRSATSPQQTQARLRMSVFLQRGRPRTQCAPTPAEVQDLITRALDADGNSPCLRAITPTKALGIITTDRPVKFPTNWPVTSETHIGSDVPRCQHQGRVVQRRVAGRAVAWRPSHCGYPATPPPRPVVLHIRPTTRASGEASGVQGGGLLSPSSGSAAGEGAEHDHREGCEH